MAQVRHLVTAPGKEPVEFFAPDGASDADLQQLASQALAAQFPRETFVTPVLDAGTRKSLERAPRKLTQDEILARQGDLSSRDPSFRERDIEGITSALSGLGFSDMARAKASNLVNDIYDWTPVGSVEAANEAVVDAGGGRYLDAAGNALIAGLDAIPEVGQAAGTGASALAMFLGRNAKTANLDLLYKAEKMHMEASKANNLKGPTLEDKRKIWDETGWFQGADGQWRFEVPDDQLAIREGELPYGVRPAFDQPISGTKGTLEHPALQEAYSDVVTGIKTGPALGGRNNGSWNEQTGHLLIAPDLSEKKQRSTVAHELQHFVQDTEGFARGGAPGYSLTQRVSGDEAARIRQEYADALEERLNRLDADEADPEIPAVEARIKTLEQQLKQVEVPEYEAYRRLAGEVEARNVQTRLDMTPGQRRHYAPWETEDVPLEQQFVIRDNDGISQQLSADPPGTVPVANALTGKVKPSKKAMATAKKLSVMAGSPAGGGKKLSTREIKKLSEDYLRQVEQGQAGADWYEQSGRSIMSHMGEDEPAAVKLAGAIGVTSSRTPVLPNLEHGVRGHYQVMAGDPVATGGFPTAMGKSISDIYAAPDIDLQGLRDLGNEAFGPKRTPFIQQNLMYEGFEPGQQSTARAVHDIWDMRARGYTNPDGTPFSGTPGAATHRWADIQDQGYLLPEANLRQIGGRTDWDTGRAQAAAWVGNKIDALMREGKTFEEAQKIAVTDYSHGWDRLYANHSWESAPGSNTGHMAGFDDLPWAEKQAYHNEVETAFLNPEGQSRIALGYGLPTGKSYDTAGLYEGVVSPGTQDLVAVARGSGSQEIDPSSGKMMNALAATQGILGAQKGAAWNFQSPAKSSLKDATAFRFDLGRTLSLEDIERFGPRIQERFPAGNVGLLPDPSGMKVVKFWDEEGDDLAGFVKDMQKEGGLSKPFPTTQSGNYMENAWDAPEGRFGGQYVNVLRGLDIPKLEAKFDSFAPGIARKMVDDIDPVLMKEAGLTGSADIERLRKTIANEGWQGLVKLVESQKGSVDAKAALLAALAGLAGAGVGVTALGETQP